MKTNDVSSPRTGWKQALAAFAVLLSLAPVADRAAAAPADTEPAPTSKLTGIALTGAQRITRPETVAEITVELNKIAKEAGAKIRVTEVLVWSQNYKPAQGPALMKKVTQSLQKAGFTYKEMSQQQTDSGKATLFLTGREKKKEALVGLWMQTEEFLLLSWARMEAP